MEGKEEMVFHDPGEETSDYAQEIKVADILRDLGERAKCPHIVPDMSMNAALKVCPNNQNMPDSAQQTVATSKDQCAIVLSEEEHFLGFFGAIDICSHLLNLEEEEKSFFLRCQLTDFFGTNIFYSGFVLIILSP